MKKLIVGFLLVFMISFSQVYALETIVTVEDMGNDYLLEQDNYQIIENGVNWNETGDYQTEYFNLIDQLYETRNVIVTDLTKLQQGISNVHQTQIPLDFCAKGINKIDEHKMLIYGGKNNGYFPYQSQNEALFAYVTLFINSQMYWEKVISDVYYGLIRDSVITERGVAVIGDFDTPNQGRNIFICEYSISGQLLFKKEITGENDDFAQRLFYFNNTFYFIASSQSLHGDFEAVGSSENNIIAGLLSKENNYEVSLIALGNNGKNIFQDVVFSNGQFFILANIVGDGYFTSHLNENNYLGIITFDLSLNLIEWASLSPFSLGDIIKLQNYQQGIGISSSYFAINRMQIFYFSNSLEYQFYKTLTICEGNYQILDCLVFSSQDKILCLTKGFLEGELKWFLYLYDDAFQLLNVERFSCDNILEKSINLTFDNEENIMVGSVNENETLIIKQLSLIKVEEVITGTNSSLTKQYRLFINGFEEKGLIFENTVGINPFGQYVNKNEFVTQQFRIILPVYLTFFLQTNIRSQETYDSGTKIYFNGKGFLNGNEIKTGHLLEESGNYFLEIIGNNGEQSSFIFTVSHLSETNSDIVQDKTILEASLAENTVFNSEEEHFVQLITNNSTSKSLPNWAYSIFLGIILGLGLFSLLSIKKGFWKKHV